MNVNPRQTSGRRIDCTLLVAKSDENEHVDHSEYLDIQKFDFTKRTPPSLFENGSLTDSAEHTCNTIEFGFEMTISQNILFNGNGCTESFEKTENATKLLMNIYDNKGMWFADKQEEMFKRICKLEELLTAIENKDHESVMRIYYRSQHIHTFDEYNSSPLEVLVYVEEDRVTPWLPYIRNAIADISLAAPGINFVYSNKHLNGYTNYIKISIIDPTADNPAYTSLAHGYPFIHLGKVVNPDTMKGTSIHELLHALGFFHAMNRFDSNIYLDIHTDGLNDCDAYQYKSNPKYGMLTRFDPFSIMMYPENKNMKRAKGDNIWELKRGPEKSQYLNELDKVALNLMYKPCKSDSDYPYLPVISETTNILYCGRNVMQTHNQNVPTTISSKYGPQMWANCPSCRVFKDVKSQDGSTINIAKVKRWLDQEKWQGLSGNVYCGKKFEDEFITFRFGKYITTDGVCGPDQGIPCTDCGSLLKPNYKYQDFKPK